MLDFSEAYRDLRLREELLLAQFESRQYQHQLRKILQQAPPGEGYAVFGDRKIPLSYPFHLRIDGQTGAGKSHLLDRYILSIYEAIARGNKYFWQLHTKNDGTDQLIKGLCQKHQIEYLVYRLDKITEDSFAIDVAKSMNGKALRFLQFSKSIFASAQSSNGDPFWHLTGELITFNLLRGLHSIYGNDFGLHHLVDLGLSTLPLINRFLSETERGKQVSQRLLGGKVANSTRESILATIAAYIQDLEAAAAIQAQLPQSRWYSLKELITGHSKSVFIYAPSEYQYATQKPIHALFSWLVPEITSLLDQQSSPRHGFITIDELNYWGKIPKLLQLAQLARSTGYHLAIAYQNKKPLEQDYGRELASILGCTTVKCVFTPTSDESAKSFLNELGENREYITDYSFSQGSFNRSIREVTRPPLSTGQLYLDMASPETGLNFWLQVPNNLGYLYRVRISPQEIDRQMAYIEAIKASVRQRSTSSQRPKQFTLKQQFQVLQKMLNSEQNYQLFMEGWQDSDIAPIRKNVWYTISHLVNAIGEDLFEFIANQLHENH